MLYALTMKVTAVLAALGVAGYAVLLATAGVHNLDIDVDAGVVVILFAAMMALAATLGLKLDRIHAEQVTACADMDRKLTDLGAGMLDAAREVAHTEVTCQMTYNERALHSTVEQAVRTQVGPALRSTADQALRRGMVARATATVPVNGHGNGAVLSVLPPYGTTG